LRWGCGLPAICAEGGAAFPGSLAGALEAGMQKLDSSGGAMGMEKVGDPGERCRLGIIPDSGAALCDAASRVHGRRLHEDEACTAECKAAEMDEVEVRRLPTGRAVHCHWRNDDTIAKRQPA